MNIKVEEYMQSQKFKKKKGSTVSRSESSIGSSRVAPDDYEEMIQKYEGDIRNHIKVE